MEFDRIGAYDVGLYDVVDYGFGSFITRPIAQYIISPSFRFLGSLLPNYGLVIILFAIAVKMLLYPLTKVSYKNTARMRELQPKMEIIKEKYADDPQKQQEAMMKMYRETGVNPLAGCLPLLLQYPIIIALWRYFQNSIVIRQEEFLWAHDLSAPDPILNLPFEIPFYGDFVAGFTLIMGLAMVVQMKVAMPASTSGTQAKIMQYFLPGILFVVFNRLASGLSLYYLTFNILSIFQQRMINKAVESGEDSVDADTPKGKAGRNGRARQNGQAAGKRSRRTKGTKP
jgi:YidC/Oxa1 family membrane protein insertase